MRINLTVEEGPQKGRVFEFREHAHFLVGRSSRAHFRMPPEDKFFSRIHFMVELNPPLCRLLDMGSTNGTAVNGVKVDAVDLEDGDLIRAGKTVLRVSVTGDNPANDPDTGTLLTRRGQPAPVDHPPEFRTAEIDLPGQLAPTVDHPASPHRAASGARPCRACDVPPGERAFPGDPPLCPACRDRIRDHPQPIAGYRVVRELGRGGMGVVYLALRDADGTRVALKTIQPALAASEVEIQRFIREASILGQLDHPNIVAFREIGETGGILHFAMDFVPGVDASRLQKDHGGPLPIPRAVGLVCQMLRALDYAHTKGFVHRDIKPANLLVARVGDREVVKLTDFGLARVYQCSRMSGLTMKGDLGGTAAYMAPEQITELRESRPPVDLYASGATLYRLVTDHHIYDLPARLEQQIMKILLEDPVPILSRRPDIPAGLAEVIHRSLQREPGARFPDANAMRKALAPFSP